MSDQQAPPAAAPSGGAPDPKDVAELHDHAVQAERHVEQLATGLGKVGADPAAIKAVSSMADMLRRVAHGLGQAGIKQPSEAATTDQATEQMMAERAAARPQ